MSTKPPSKYTSPHMNVPSEPSSSLDSLNLPLHDQEKLDRAVEDAFRKCMAQQELVLMVLLTAFLEETGLRPSELELVHVMDGLTSRLSYRKIGEYGTGPGEVCRVCGRSGDPVSSHMEVPGREQEAFKLPSSTSKLADEQSLEIQRGHNLGNGQDYALHGDARSRAAQDRLAVHQTARGDRGAKDHANGADEIHGGDDPRGKSDVREHSQASGTQTVKCPPTSDCFGFKRRCTNQVDGVGDLCHECRALLRQSRVAWNNRQ